jgi:hypothetical protein
MKRIIIAIFCFLSIFLSINRLFAITWPLTNTNWLITSVYGPDRGHSRNWHYGIDIGTAGTEQPALAVLNGYIESYYPFDDLDDVNMLQFSSTNGGLRSFKYIHMCREKIWTEIGMRYVFSYQSGVAGDSRNVIRIAGEWAKNTVYLLGILGTTTNVLWHYKVNAVQSNASPVTEGSVIAYTGKEGTESHHLHFEYMTNNATKNPFTIYPTKIVMNNRPISEQAPLFSFIPASFVLYDSSVYGYNLYNEQLSNACSLRGSSNPPVIYGRTNIGGIIKTEDWDLNRLELFLNTNVILKVDINSNNAWEIESICR